VSGTSEITWDDMRRGIAKAAGEVAGQSWTEKMAERCLFLLEANGLVLLPVRARKDADLFGTAVVVKTMLGYDVLSATSWRVEQVAGEDKA
jgi:hypothetical protein